MKRILLALVTLVACSAPAAAQTSSRPKPKESVGFRAYGVFDTTAVAATKSFDAIFGSSQTFGGGGGAEVDVWHHLFLRIAVTHAQRTGSRVFVDDGGQVFPLNIPLRMSMTPIEGGAGWRFVSRKSRATPYLGGGFVSVGYHETSDFGQSGDVVDERYTGAEAFGGVAVGISKHLFAGGEAQYRHVAVPTVSTSVMQQFGETDLGGFTVRVLIGFRSR